MKKLKNKLKLLEVMFSLLLQTIQFRIKVLWRKISARLNNSSSLTELGIVKHRVFNIVIFYAIVFSFLFYFLFLSAPANFPMGTIIKIEQGNSLRSVSLELKQKHVIRSRLAFEALVIILDKEKRIISSDYYFETKLPVFEIARRISKGEHRLAPIVVTIPEGFDLIQIADIFVLKLPNFDKNKFLAKAQTLEGYLFPDTYFFFITDNEQEVIKLMKENFEKKIASIRSDILLSRKTEKEIIIMASLIEGEAKGEIDRGFISGILWKRMAIGMLLQVDASLETYKVKGLPKNPINNPGLAAIRAAIHPQKSPYLYYLHDKNGNIHYAKSFIEHQQNVLKYLAQ